MTLNGRYALCCRKDASFGAYHKNLNEDRSILSAAKMEANASIFWQYKTCANIFGGSQGGGVKRQCGCRQRQFLAFSLACFRDEASVIIWQYAVRRRLFSDPKMLDLNDLDWQFRVKFCFRAGLAG